MTALLLIIVLAVLVLAHELGHFLIAKWSGIDVEEFGLGLPPRAWGKKFGDTLYSLNWIPFGGFVRIAGDDEDATPGAGTTRAGRGFKEKSFFTKTGVMAGGVIANAYLAFVLIAVAFWIGLPVSRDSFPNVPMRDTWVAVVGVSADSPAAALNLSIPSRVMVISKDGQRVVVDSPQDMQDVIRNSLGKELSIYVRDTAGAESEYLVTPTQAPGILYPSIGVMLDNVGIPDLGFFASLRQSFLFSGQLLTDTAYQIVMLIGSAFAGNASLEAVSGPVGIAGILASAKAEGPGPLLFIIALISMSLAVINFVPFPALDGGRFLFLVIESVIRRPIKPVISRTVNLAGFALLLLLMVFVTYQDIVRL